VADLDQIDSFISDISAQAAAWFSVFTNRPAVVPSTAPELLRLQTQTGVIQPIATAPTPIVSGGSDLSSILLLLGVVVVAVLLFRD